MKPKPIFTIACLIICATLKLSAQTSATSSNTSTLHPEKADSKKEHKRNFIKINLTSIALKNYSIQYERVLSKAISFSASFRTMPSTTLPFNHLILKAIGDNMNTKKVIENVRLGNFAFTPEVRFYVGKKGYGRGFYFAPFYRYASFSTNSLTFDFQNTAGAQSSINLSGKLTANTGGLLLGAQWYLGKSMCLDWWILGPHYGSGTGDFTGVASKPLTADEQNNLRAELEDLEIPLTNKTVVVNANSASLKLNGPWGGIRAGISLGVRF
jgi:hypothetical protein